MNSFLDNRSATKADGNSTTAKPGAGFQSLLSREAQASRTPADFQPLPASKAETEPVPQVELVESGGKVDRIIITCTCCNKIELQCQY